MQGMVIIASTLHFAYSDMLNMEIGVFMDFVKYSNEIIAKQAP